MTRKRSVRHGITGDGAMQTPLGAMEGAAALDATCGSGMGIVVVFQDPLTRQWATDAWERVSDVLCRVNAGLRFWRMDDLVHPRVAEEAIRAAAEASIIMVALRDVIAPPPTLCVWNEGWLAQRKSSAGLLVSIVGVHHQKSDLHSYIDDYLGAIAMRGGLDYLPRQHPLPPDAISPFDIESIADRANATTQVMGEILRQGHHTGEYKHWGINE